MIYEPAVTYTDLALAAENALFAALVARVSTSPGSFGRTAAQPSAARISPALRCAFVAFFGALAVAAVAGAIVHGWMPDETAATHIVIWRLTLMAIFTASAAGLHAAGTMFGVPRLGRALTALTLVAGAVVVITNVRGYAETFGVVIAFYVPASVLLLAAFARWRLWLGVLGMLLTFVAAGVQQSTVQVWSLDHNALYHLIQAVALLLIFIAARRAILVKEHAASLSRP